MQLKQSDSSTTETCIGCTYLLVIPDPDPNDWFCDNDEAAVCQVTPNPEKDEFSKYKSDQSPFRAVTKSCRPYRLEKECQKPKWCPKK